MNQDISVIKGIHPGIILGLELKKRKLVKASFALSIGEYPQTLCAVTKGSRNMNTVLALKIEKALKIEEGYLMILQVFYDIRLAKRLVYKDRHLAHPFLTEWLMACMEAPPLAGYWLAGGMALSLHYGHRLASDIDLFKDKRIHYFDFAAIQDWLLGHFKYVESGEDMKSRFERSYYVGISEYNCVKLVLHHTNHMLHRPFLADGVRMMDIEDIVALTVELIFEGGHKQDFWDLHELLGHYSIAAMIELHRRRYFGWRPEEAIREKFVFFSVANKDKDPECLKGKQWKRIKHDFREALR